MDIKTIHENIEQRVTQKIDQGQPVAMNWITQEILNDYSDLQGGDREFYVICARHYVADKVKRQIKRFEPSSEETSPQLVMEGFEHLQKAYPVERNKERIIMPVDLMTDEEILERAQNYMAMAKGCQDHAVELKRYLKQRESQAVV